MLKTLSVLGLTLAFLAGCNTMSGMGKDIERGGEKLQKEATPKSSQTPSQNQTR